MRSLDSEVFEKNKTQLESRQSNRKPRLLGVILGGTVHFRDITFNISLKSIIRLLGLLDSDWEHENQNGLRTLTGYVIATKEDITRKG